MRPAAHEVELVRRVLSRVPDSYDPNEPKSPFGRRTMHHRELVERVVHQTLSELGITIRPDGTIALPVVTTGESP